VARESGKEFHRDALGSKSRVEQASLEFTFLPLLTLCGVSALPPKAAAALTDRRVRFGP
jgi:hypothetical protein